MKNTLVALLSLFTGFLFAQPQIELEVIASGFDRPVDIENAGDDRLFIVEQPGSIRIIDANGDVLSTPFLSITNIVNDSGNERGLLGLAFHPDYVNNGYFFVNYTGDGGDTFVSRYSVSDFNPNVADASSELVILTFDQPSSNHNGGDIAFGPDGYLYIGTGDGGGAGDTQNNSQTTSKYLGKMLRIDVNSGTPYSIPADNPFVADPNVLDEIWAIGLRNPWRYSFDRETGDLWIADVGQESWEEIDFQPAGDPGGQNYGWRCYEGIDHPYNTNNCGPASDYVNPIFDYVSNNPTGCSVTGGFVYRGCRFPELVGHYIFADYCTGRFWSIIPDGNGGWIDTELDNQDNFEFSSFGEDRNGELFVTYLGDGTIARVVETQSSFVVEDVVTNASCEDVSNGQIELVIASDDPPQSVVWEDGTIGSTLSELEAGTYEAEIVTATGCTMYYSVEVGADVPTTPTIEVDGLTLSVSNGPFESYQWFVGGISISTDPTIQSMNGGGEYTVTVVDANGCETTSAVFPFYYLSTSDFDLVSEITFGPNPVSDVLAYELEVKEAGALWLEIVDVRGAIIQSEKLEVLPGNRVGALNVENLPAGVFVLKLRSENAQTSTKLIKQ